MEDRIMREGRIIKFRFWDPINKEFNYFILDGYCNLEFGSSTLQANFAQQYTGLKDKNQEEIYEGDIVIARHYGMNGTDIFDVRYYENRFSIFQGELEQGDYNCIDDPSYINWGDLEVMGNIYENTELLEEKYV
jgi:uncharacterized phage protein (TIGR01671 family)